MMALSESTGFRKSEVALPNGEELDDRRLRRASPLWEIDGIHTHTNPKIPTKNPKQKPRSIQAPEPEKRVSNWLKTRSGSSQTRLPAPPAAAEGGVPDSVSWSLPESVSSRFETHISRRRLY